MKVTNVLLAMMVALVMVQGVASSGRKRRASDIAEAKQGEDTDYDEDYQDGSESSEEEDVDGGEVEEAKVADEARYVVLQARPPANRKRTVNVNLPSVCRPPAKRRRSAKREMSAFIHAVGDRLLTESGNIHRGILRVFQGSDLLPELQLHGLEMAIESRREDWHNGAAYEMNQLRNRFTDRLTKDLKLKPEEADAGWNAVRDAIQARREAELEEDLLELRKLGTYAVDHPEEVCGSSKDKVVYRPRSDDEDEDGGMGGGGRRGLIV